MAKSYRTKFLVSLTALAAVLVVQLPPLPTPPRQTARYAAWVDVAAPCVVR